MLLLSPKSGGAVIRSAMKPAPVEVVGETGGIRVQHRRSDSNRGEERCGTVTMATDAGVSCSVAAVAVAVEFVAVGGGCCRGSPVAGRVGE